VQIGENSLKKHQIAVKKEKYCKMKVWNKVKIEINQIKTYIL
jgi:hypothetical protein